MSQIPQPGFNQPKPFPQSLQPPKENGFGLAGFIVSIAGLVLCGVPSIVGVILSMIGLGKEPKGLAIAGLILGMIGLLEVFVVGFLTFSAYQVAQNAGSFLQEFAIEAQLNDHASAIGDQWESSSQMPNQSEGEEILKGKRDMIGNQIIYETNGTSFTLRTAGADGTLQTDDDITVGPFSDAESTRQPQFDESDFDFGEGSADMESIKELMEAAQEAQDNQ